MTTQLEHSHVNLLHNYLWVVPSNVVETIYMDIIMKRISPLEELIYYPLRIYFTVQQSLCTCF